MFIGIQKNKHKIITISNIQNEHSFISAAISSLTSDYVNVYCILMKFNVILISHYLLKKLTDNTGHGIAPGMNEIMSSLHGGCSDWNYLLSCTERKYHYFYQLTFHLLLHSFRPARNDQINEGVCPGIDVLV